MLIAGRIGDQFPKGAAIFLAARMGIEGGAGGALGDQFLQFQGSHVQGLGQFQPVGLATKPVAKFAADPPHLREFLADVDRQADGAGAVVDGPRHALADPPIGVGGKFVAHGRIELVDGPFQTDGPFLNQIQQLQALVLILLGHAHHQAQVGGHHPVAGALAHADLSFLLGREALLRQLLEGFARLDVVGEFDFLGWREQGHPADGAQVPAD